jgi:hypothetical protein
VVCSSEQGIEETIWESLPALPKSQVNSSEFICCCVRVALNRKTAALASPSRRRETASSLLLFRQQLLDRFVQLLAAHILVANDPLASRT